MGRQIVQRIKTLHLPDAVAAAATAASVPTRPRAKSAFFAITPDCPEWYNPSVYTYPFYYQDDPNADDLPSSLSSYINGFETRGRSYFVGINELRAMPLDISQLEICAVARGLCVASCLSLRPLASAQCTATSGLSDAQRTVALVAGTCGRSLNCQQYFTTQTRSQFYRGGFYANEASMQSGQKAAGYENKGWACPLPRRHGAARRPGEVAWHVWGWGVSLDNTRSNVEIGNDCADQTRVHRAAADVAARQTRSINGHVGRPPIVFARIGTCNTATLAALRHRQCHHAPPSRNRPRPRRHRPRPRRAPPSPSPPPPSPSPPPPSPPPPPPFAAAAATVSSPPPEPSPPPPPPPSPAT